MARPLRIEYPGAWYHVMNRGAGRRKIFKNDEQRRYVLSLLADTYERFNAEWHAYCLMGNHYHLLIRTPEGNLQRIMRHINGLYTQHFNRSEKKDGPLFRGRYKAILVDADAYWLQLSRYIHRNPLDAGICDRLQSYRWSSYRAYIGADKVPDWLMTRYILAAIGHRNRREHYKAYVAGDTDEALLEFYSRARISPILGDDLFKAKVLSGKSPNVDIPELASARARPPLERIASETSHHFGVDASVIWQSTRGRGVTTPARSVAMYLCQQLGDMRLSEIADAFGLATYASAGATIRSVKQRITEDKELKKAINSIILDLTP